MHWASRRRWFCGALAVCLSTAAVAEPILFEGSFAVDIQVDRGPRASADDVVKISLAGPDESLVAVVAPGGTNLLTRDRTKVAATVGLPEPGESAVYRLTRRPDCLTLHRDGVLIGLSRRPPRGPAKLLVKAAGPTAKVLLAQDLEPVYATDDFAPRDGNDGGWDAIDGSWRIGVYRDPLVAKYHLPPQASWYECQPSDGRAALALLGDDFWGDYAVGVDLRLDGGRRAGVVFAAAADNRHGLFRIGGGKAEIVGVTPAGERVYAAAPYDPEPDSWARLAVICSNGHIRAGINGRWLLAIDLPAYVAGRVGLWSDAPAGFDNFKVEDARLCREDFGGSQPDDRWDVEAGPWQAREGAIAGWRTATSQPILMANAAPLDGGEMSTRLLLPRDGEAGVRMALGGGRAYTFTLRRRGDRLGWRVARHGPDSAEVAGGDCGEDSAGWHDVAVRRRGAGFEGLVDGRVVTTWYDDGGPARAGICVLGPNGALFDRALFYARAIPPAAELFTTNFSLATIPGKLKSEVWRVLGDVLRPQGREWRLPPDSDPEAGQLVGEPTDGPIELTYRDPLPGDAGIAVQIGELAEKARLSLTINPADGYRLELTRDRCRLLRAGEVVGEAGLRGSPLLARLWRDGYWVAAEVDGRRLVWRDPNPPLAGPVGISLEGGRATLGELTITAENAFATTFAVIDTAWRQAGPWRWNSGMACIAWSYWISADGREGPTLLWRREPFGGDLSARFYVSEYTDGYDEASRTHQHFPYHDISLVIEADGVDPDSGYRFVIGAGGGRSARLLRRGKVVAENPGFTITMGSHCNSPRSIYVEASHRGGRLTLRLNGDEALAYDDPEPLAGAGYIALGVERCRANFSDLSVHRPPLDGS